MHRPHRMQERGVSLVEAMVALAVMAFGTLAVLGVQTTLRLNADIAKQRNEAVRIAQETIEQVRTFDDLATYNALSSDDEPVDVDGYTVANTTYQVQQTVVDAGTPADPNGSGVNLPRRKTLVVDVTWTDRADQLQQVRLTAAIQGTPPAIAGSLVVSPEGAAVRNPQLRHASIPVEATISADGRTSAFTPASGVTWVFNNANGYITQTCASSICTDVNARLLAGYVRFPSDRSVTPTAQEAEQPLGLVPTTTPPIGVKVVQTAPADRAGDVICQIRFSASARYLPYYCAVPVGSSTMWSGRSLVVMPDIATTSADASLSHSRVCRYTERLGNFVVPSEMRNDEHPLDYVNVTGALVNQNFLVIAAGNGSTPFVCPDESDGTGTLPFLSGNTYPHQPSV